MREECGAAIEALVRDGDLAPGWTTEAATGLLWAMLSVKTWRRLREGCGWSAEDCVSRRQAAARGAFVVRR